MAKKGGRLARLGVRFRERHFPKAGKRRAGGRKAAIRFAPVLRPGLPDFFSNEPVSARSPRLDKCHAARCAGYATALSIRCSSGVCLRAGQRNRDYWQRKNTARRGTSDEGVGVAVLPGERGHLRGAPTALLKVRNDNRPVAEIRRILQKIEAYSSREFNAEVSPCLKSANHKCRSDSLKTCNAAKISRANSTACNPLAVITPRSCTAGAST